MGFYNLPNHGLPKGVLPHVEVQLKQGWRYNQRRRSLVSDDGASVVLRGLLPAGAKMQFVDPYYADVDPRSLSESESFLARCLLASMPAGQDLGELKARLRTLDGVENVSGAPVIGLPSGDFGGPVAAPAQPRAVHGD